MSINRNTFNEICSFLMHSRWITSKDAVSILVDQLIVLACVRPVYEIEIVQLIDFLIKKQGPKNSLDVLKPTLFEKLQRSFHNKASFPSASSQISLIHQLYRNNTFTIEDISKLFYKLLNDNRTFARTTCWLFCIFAPEIEDHDVLLYKRILSTYDKATHLPNFAPMFREFWNDLPELSKNDWQLFIQRRNYILGKDNIFNIIKYDDIDTLRKLSMKESFRFGQTIPASVYINNSFLQGEPTLLQLSAFFGSVQCFKFILLHHPPLDYIDSSFNSLAQFAIAGGNLEIIRICQQIPINFSGCFHTAMEFHRLDIFQYLSSTVRTLDLLSYDSSGFNILHSATQSDYLAGVLYCIEQIGINPNDVTINQSTPLRIAITYGSYFALRYLVNIPTIDLTGASQHNICTLHVVAKYGSLSSLKMFLALSDLDINVVTNQGNTPLHVAVEHGQVKIINYLMNQQSINANPVNLQGLTPLQDAIISSRDKIIRVLLDYPKVSIAPLASSMPCALSLAITGNRVNVIKMILARKDCDPNYYTKNNLSPLHQAIQLGRGRIMRELLEDERIDVNLKNGPNKITPLIRAISRESDLLVDMLLSTGKVNVNLCSKSGVSALQAAVMQRNIAIVEILLKIPELNPNIQNMDSMTPIYYCLVKDRNESLKKILERTDVNVNVKNSNGNTPLHMAVVAGSEEAVRTLLACPSVNIKETNDFGMTPEQLAVKKKKSNLISIFRRYRYHMNDCLVQ